MAGAELGIFLTYVVQAGGLLVVVAVMVGIALGWFA